MRQKVLGAFLVRKIEKALVEQHVRVLLFALLQDRLQKRAGDGFSGGVVGRAEKQRVRRFLRQKGKERFVRRKVRGMERKAYDLCPKVRCSSAVL